MDCPLGPLELAGSGESPLESVGKGGECKVHKTMHYFTSNHS
jgi:hypothetical protein